MLERIDRYRGMLVGLAVGDAVGTTLEFVPRDWIHTPLTDMVGGGPFNLKAGQWTDDTSMALCMATSLLDCGHFDAKDQMDRYVLWWKEGYMSPTGACFDIGGTTITSLKRYLGTNNPYAGVDTSDTAGNGSLMRLAPAVLFAFETHQDYLQLAEMSSKTTHANKEAVECCRLMAYVLGEILLDSPKNKILTNTAMNTPWDECVGISSPSVLNIAYKTFLTKSRDEIKGSGYCVESLEAAMWCFFNTDSYKDAVLEAANLGDDADTTAAIVGQIAGAYYGYEAIPDSWKNKIYMHEEIREMADRFFYMNQQYENMCGHCDDF